MSGLFQSNPSIGRPKLGFSESSPQKPATREGQQTAGILKHFGSMSPHAALEAGSLTPSQIFRLC
jgi:hypothetical protein